MTSRAGREGTTLTTPAYVDALKTSLDSVESLLFKLTTGKYSFESQ